MNRRFVFPVLIVVSLSFIASQSYACNPRPTPVIGPYDDVVCVEEVVDFDGGYPDYSHDNDEEGYCITEYDWYFPGADAVTGGNTGSPTARWDSAGTYEVKLWVKDNEGQWCDAPDTCYVSVVKVEKVVQCGWPDRTGPLYRMLEDWAQLEAIPFPGTSWPSPDSPIWEIVEPVPEGANPKLSIYSGYAATTLYDLTVPGDYIVRAKSCNSDTGDEITVTVVTVEGLTWVTYPDDVVADPDHGPNITLEPCPKNEGKRIFPGKKYYEDSTEPPEHNETKMRQKVKIKATLSAAPDRDDVGYVMFKCWDVDDPCYGTAPLDEDDDDPDPNKHSIDNRGFYYLEGGEHTIYVWPESGSNVVDANFYVSYQPGDNYRITATTRLVTKHNDITRCMVETGSLPSTVKRSDMLTTWRKVWVERDYMAPVPSTGGEMNRVLGTADSCTYNQTAGETTVDLGRLLPYWLDDIDQFEGGWLKFTDSGNTYPVISSTHNLLFDDEVVVTGNCSTESDKSYILFDDDDQDLFDSPYYCSFDACFDAFKDAYIKPTYLPDSYSDQVNFNLNMTEDELSLGVDYDNEQEVWSSSDFWACLVVSCYQPWCSVDGDPDGIGPGDPETDTYFVPGATPTDYDNAAAIFVETRNDCCLWSEDQVVAHEVGHTGGANDHEGNLCLMYVDCSSNISTFCHDCLNTFRESAWLN